MKPTLARELVLDALLMAVWRRRPQQNVLVHSDQNSQLGQRRLAAVLRRQQPRAEHEPTRQLLGTTRFAESFFSSLKKEHIRNRIYKTRDLATADVFDYIEVFYNRTRCHGHLGGVSPEAFERASS
jgi:putative transposase